MWRVRKFQSFAAQERWRTANAHRYQIVVIYINNGYAVEYRPLRVI